MFFGNVAKIEVTTSVERVNELLNEQWLLLDVRATDAGEFIFLVGLGEFPRKKILGIED